LLLKNRIFFDFCPQIVVTVLAEESGEGSNIAASITKKILEAYFSEK